MKLRLIFSVFMLLAFSAKECGAIAACRTLRPDPAAWAERMERSASGSTSSPRLLASNRAETLLDVVDVLVAFDLSAQRWLSDNGKGTPEEYALNKVRDMNGCLANSYIDKFKFRLAGVVRVGEDASLLRDAYGDVDLQSILVDHLVNERGYVVASGEWAKVTDTREELGADIVSVLVDAGDYGNIGLGFSLEDSEWNVVSRNLALIPEFGDWAYSVCSIRVVDLDHSMLHEIGHNMGCGHPNALCTFPGTMYLGPQLYPYSAGYYAWIDGEGYYTIMGYNFGGLLPDGSYDPHVRFTEMPCFSSPQLVYKGVSLGTTYNDNRQTLLNTYAYVAQYRASRLPADASAGMDGAGYSDIAASGGGLVSRVFSTEFRPAKAVNGVAPYIGAAYDGERPVAIISLRCGKTATSGKLAGTSKVSAAVTGLDCRQKGSTTVNVTCGYDAKAVLDIKNWGRLLLTLGGEGFSGSLANMYGARTASVGGAWPHASAVVDVDFGTGALPAGTLVDLLPTGNGAESVLNANGKWKFAPAAMVKYAAVRNGASETTYELQGTSDPQKTNRSAMRLTYNAKKGTFSGSFKVYAVDTSGTKHRLRRLSAKVTGIVVDSVGYGKAEIRNVGSFPVTVGPRQ